MTSRIAVTLFSLSIVAACGGGPDADASATAETTAAAGDEAAIEQIRADYVTHYNLHHASVVADLFSDSAIALFADGGVHMGKPAIAAELEADMAASPTISLTSAEVQVFGDNAVGRGEYTVNLTPPGAAAITLTGNYLTHFVRENGAWKIGSVTSNYNAPPPEGAPSVPLPPDNPPENGTMKEFNDAYTEHYNLGHASVVAGMYTEDATAAFSRRPLAQGRAAIEAALTEVMADGSPKITIHDVGTTDLADGWKLDGGWYEVTSTPTAGPARRVGVYMRLARRAEDGTWKNHWVVTNSQTAPAQ